MSDSISFYIVLESTDKSFKRTYYHETPLTRLELNGLAPKDDLRGFDSSLIRLAPTSEGWSISRQHDSDTHVTVNEAILETEEPLTLTPHEEFLVSVDALTFALRVLAMP